VILRIRDRLSIRFFALAVAGWLARPDARDLRANIAGDNAVLLWNNAALQAIRDTVPGPTITARALAIVHTCMFDAWTAYDRAAVPTVSHHDWRRPRAQASEAGKALAVSFAAYRALIDLFPIQRELFDRVMRQLGCDPSNATMDPATPEGIGNSAAAAVLDVRHRDGSNQLGDLSPGAYSDYTGYHPVNSPAAIVDPDRWQPLSVVNFGGQPPQAQVYLTPHWGNVAPFSMTSGSMLRPAPPARYPSAGYRDQAAEMIAVSAALTDEQKVTSEYFADGPNTEFPPGHWARFAELVSRRDRHTLDDDVKMFFALANALLDASISAWDAKRTYDSERPATAIHCLYAGRLIRAWGGPFQGTSTILGEDWRPYQSSAAAGPPFPEHFSGHSVFSAAAAEILRSCTGSDAFGASVTIRTGNSIGEPGLVPAFDVTLRFRTFSDAADQAGMSRRYGGIHFAQGDLIGRSLGRVIGAAVWAKASTYFDGTANQIEADPTERPHSPVADVKR
jgi:hypothetical protein